MYVKMKELGSVGGGVCPAYPPPQIRQCHIYSYQIIDISNEADELHLSFCKYFHKPDKTKVHQTVLFGLSTFC